MSQSIRTDRTYRTSTVDTESLENLQDLVEGINGNQLEPLSPDDGVSMYLAERKEELRDTSLTTHRSALGFFCDWCAQEGVENLNSLTGRQLHQYRLWRREEATTKVDRLAKESEKTQQDVLRQFIRYCESIDGVKTGLHEKVRSPSLSRDETARSDIIEAERAAEILTWLRKFKYGSNEHIVWEILADTGLRIGALVALDTQDYCPDEEPAHLRIQHRPETGTQLKNGVDGERFVALGNRARDVLDDYIEQQRLDEKDPNGRSPLIATRFGRISRGTIRKYVYKWSRPCAVGQNCPHDRDPEDCEASSAHDASKCPSSRSPHAIRRGYITHELASGVDRSFVSGRCNVSEAIIEQHYDERDEDARMRVRHKALRAARQDSREYGGR